MQAKSFRAMRTAVTAIALYAGLSSTTIASAAQPTLDTFEQIAHERRALQILNLPEVQQQKKHVEDMYRKNWLAKTHDGGARLENAANMFALFAVQLALLDDPARPKIIWENMLAHDWQGIPWPGANWGIDNPDNVYRYLIVDGTSRYEISGQTSQSPPMQQTFVLYSSIPGTSEKNLEGAKVIGSLASDDLVVNPDGSFLITMGPEAGAPGTNHIQTAPDAKAVFIRDTMGDWSTSLPNQLRVRRVAGAPADAPKTDEEVAKLAAVYLQQESSYWLTYFQERNYSNPPNTIPAVAGRSGKWGMVSTNWFRLKKNEVLVVTLDPIGAAYMNFQISDPWGVTPDYAHHTNSLNNAQSKPNDDGTYTYVIASHDPGFWNWIDTDGMDMGLFTVRWQGLKNVNKPLAATVREAKVVKMSDLNGALPPETKRITPAERSTQLLERSTSYQLRFGN